jgi:hypothetical protein
VALIIAVWQQDSLTDHVSSLLSTVGGVLAGGIAAYLGSTTPDTARTTDTTTTIATDTPTQVAGVDYAGTVGVPSIPTQESDPS